MGSKVIHNPPVWTSSFPALVSLGSQFTFKFLLLSYNVFLSQYVSSLVAISLDLIVHLLSSLMRTCLCCEYVPRYCSSLTFPIVSIFNAFSCMFSLDPL